MRPNIRRNPIEAGLAEDSRPYRYVEFLKPDFPQGLKPHALSSEVDVRAKARTLHTEALHTEGSARHSTSSEVFDDSTWQG